MSLPRHYWLFVYLFALERQLLIVDDDNDDDGDDDDRVTREVPADVTDS